jgi:hypothetical protein
MMLSGFKLTAWLLPNVKLREWVCAPELKVVSFTLAASETGLLVPAAKPFVT